MWKLLAQGIGLMDFLTPVIYTIVNGLEIKNNCPFIFSLDKRL
jgi:hypothetical protein